ncbi:MAG: hypothetical protein CMP32_02735 [Rickettsiales bacterium]|nr:hypothetical protein [Rickettsiales bacterium]|tara:strand:+ start:161 stop:553 length:393 start_codon:yes stop_codon:yes gene_type:complete
MGKEKKIEDILFSINNLITEANNEENKSKFPSEINSVSPKKFVNDDISINEETIDLQKKTNVNRSWENIKFSNYTNLLKFKETDNLKKETDEYLLLFKKKINFWISKELKKILENELSIESKKLLAEKLK